MVAEASANDGLLKEPRLSVSREDLAAYVRGGLASQRRAEIEGYLACNPDLAAEVMTALHMQGRGGDGTPTRKRRLSRRTLEIGAFVATFAGLCWFASDEVMEQISHSVPVYVKEAVLSHQATLLRAAMHSQIETSKLDANEIRRELKVRLPILPASWRVKDVQVYPSDDGPGVNLLIDTPHGMRNLFAVRANTAVTNQPEIFQQHGENVAYWEIDDSAYALSGAGSRAELLSNAAELSRGGLL